MSPPDPGPAVPLTITTEDGAAEIFVLDGNLQLAARGIGRVGADLPPGIYKIKRRVALETQEDLLVHQAPGTAKRYPPLAFSSPAPLALTIEGSDGHAEAARRESRVVHVRAGAGSSIFVFARHWSAGDTPAGADAAAGLRLDTAGGEPVADLARQSARGDDGGGPWAACTSEVEPGTYRLSVTMPDGPAFAQALAAVPGWQTQVFLRARTDEPRVDLGSSAIFVVRGTGFDPASPDLRLVEIARQGLVNRRPVLSDETRETLRSRLEQPWLGILAGHLFLQEERPDRDLVAAVVRNLRALLPVRHPDVEALALMAGLDTEFRFSLPPMLRPSWNGVVAATGKRGELVPAGSPAAALFSKLTNQEPWLIWREGADADDDVLEIFRSALAQLMTQDTLKDLRSRIERDLAGDESRVFSKDVLGSIRGVFRQVRGGIPDTVMEVLVSRLGVPRSAIESMIHDAVRRLRTLGDR